MNQNQMEVWYEKLKDRFEILYDHPNVNKEELKFVAQNLVSTSYYVRANDKDIIDRARKIAYGS